MCAALQEHQYDLQAFDGFSALKILCKKLNALETSAYILLEISDGFSALKIHYENLHFGFPSFKINNSSYIHWYISE